MLRIGFAESFVLFIALIKYAIAIAAAVWVVLSLIRTRSDVKTIQGKLEEIERLLLNKN